MREFARFLQIPATKRWMWKTIDEKGSFVRRSEGDFSTEEDARLNYERQDFSTPATAGEQQPATESQPTPTTDNASPAPSVENDDSLPASDDVRGDSEGKEANVNDDNSGTPASDAVGSEENKQPENAA